MSVRSTPIAVVGMGCRFPGGVTDAASFWRLLESGADAIGPMPAGRFDVGRFVHPEPGTPGKMVTAEGGFLEDIDRFDAEFFGLSPREARKIDPQHRLLLEVAYEALEDAGIPVSSLAGRRVGVYVGIWSGEYENVMYRTPGELDFHSITGGGRYAASGRISYAFDLRGPALTVDTGCSASLVALHLARQALESGEADLAIVGAANLVLQPHVNIGYSRSGMLSAGGRCRFGDAGAAGYVRSDGAAALVLKPLTAARADHDPVRGVVLATGVNADGRGSGQLATPSADAQAELLSAVYERAGLDPATVPYVEAHGTGTRAGDPVELEALGRVLGRDRRTPLLVGSVKTNIGHTEACAGMAGLIKTLLALEHGRIPGNLHLRTPNETIAWNDLRVEIPTSMRAWPEGAPRIAGVSSFGITGTNGHAVLAAAEFAEDATTHADAYMAGAAAGPAAVAVSGAIPEAMRQAMQRLAEWLDANPAVSLHDVAFSSTSRREQHAPRAVFVADDLAGLRAAVAAQLAGETPAGVFVGEATPEPPRIGFVFSGQGSQWLGMGTQLMQSAPAFAAAIRACEQALAPHVSWSLTEVLQRGEPDPNRIDVVQPTLGAVQIALARQLEAWGIMPDAVAGHSMGEVPAAHIAGALSLEDAMCVLATRSGLLARIAGRGAMALVDLDAQETAARIARFGARLSVAAWNGPRSTVVSGDPEAVDELLAELDDAEVFARAVRVDVASHSSQCDALLPDLGAGLAGIRPQPSRAQLYSTVEGRRRDALLDAAYWQQNLRQPVRLLPAITAMLEDGVNVIVEIAPHPILLSSIADIAAAAGRKTVGVPLLRRDEPEPQRMLESLARLHVNGARVAWQALATPGARIVRLPSYPWQRERYWLEEWEDWAGSDGARARSKWPAEANGWLYELDWVPAPAHEAPPTGVARRWLVIGAPGELREQVAAQLAAAGATPVALAPDAEVLRAALVEGRDVVQGLVLLPDEHTGDASALAIATDTLNLVQMLLAQPPARPPRVVVVTRGAQALPDAAPTVAGVSQAPLWGFMRVLRDEHPELDLRLLDLDPAVGDSEAALDVRAAACDDTNESDVVVRAGVRLAPRLTTAEVPAARAERLAWPADGATLISGGLGDLGLAVARQLLQEGVRRFVMLSRTPLPPRNRWRTLADGSAEARRVTAVLELEARGASVHVASVDVGDAQQLDQFLASYREEAWPPITAVVHTAGVIDSHLVRSMPAAAMERVFRGKVTGAWLLHVAFPDAARFVMFSSTSVLIPQAGEANYAAANAFLDALAALRRSDGHEAQVVNWGVWRNSGVIANDEGARYVEEVRRQGIDSMDPTVAVQVLTRVAAAGTPQLFVAPIDWERLRQTRGAVHLGPVFERLTTPTQGQERAAGADPLLAQLAALPAAARRAAVEERLRDMVAQVLGVRPERLRADATLGSQGLDSLMALELRNHIEGAFDLKVSATLAWNYPTLTRLSAHLLELLAPRLDSPAAEVVAARAPQLAAVAEVSVHERVQELAAVSEEDILRELRGGA
jgi:acyl transferase domain-containing protein/acyl carrier protein